MDQSPRHSNVYLTNLPPTIDTEEDLRNLCGIYGTVESCRIVRNTRGEGKSFAFCKFSGISEAMAAIAALNNAQVGTSVLEVKIADADAGDRNPELLAPPSDNLYAKNLPNTISDDELRALFSPCGTVIECRVLHSGAGRGGEGAGAGALIRMSSVSEASQAIQHLHNQRLQGSPMPLVVRYADSHEQKMKKAARQYKQFDRFGYSGGMPMGGGYHQQHQGPSHMGYYSPASSTQYGPGVCSVYIKYLPEQVNKDNITNVLGNTDRLWLYEKFAPYGAVLSVKVLTNENGTCRGVGFINYGDPDAAARAVAAMNGMLIGGDKRLFVSLQTHRSGGRAPQGHQ